MQFRVVADHLSLRSNYMWECGDGCCSESMHDVWSYGRDEVLDLDGDLYVGDQDGEPEHLDQEDFLRAVRSGELAPDDEDARNWLLAIDKFHQF